MSEKIRIAVLVSGGGTNLQALIDAQAAGQIPDGEIALVISNKTGAYALERAAKAGIPAVTVTKKASGGTQEGFEQAMLAALKAHNIDLIVLAGFLAILSADFTRAYNDRIINVHPSLIPSFCGKGFYGLHVHEKAIEYGVKLSGATCHFVTEECDGGPIIIQKAVEVKPDDTPEVLQKRIMQEAEWQILPKAVSLFCEGRIEVKGRTVYIKE